MNVRSFFAAVIMAAFSLVSVSAQRYQMGFSVGANYSNLHSDLFDVSSGRLSALVGCSFVIGLGDQFELNQEIAFLQKGARAKAAFFVPENTPELTTYDYFFNAFEASMLVGFKPAENLPVRLQAGAFWGTHFHTLDRNSRDLFVYDYENLNNAKRAVDLNDAFSGFDYGPALGVSGGDDRFRINARYFFGARNLYKNLDFVEPGHRIRTSSIRLTLTYFLK